MLYCRRFRSRNENILRFQNSPGVDAFKLVSGKEIVHRMPDGNDITLGSQLFKCPEALF